MNELWSYVAGNIYISCVSLSAVFCYGAFSVLQFLVTFQMSAYLRVLQNRIETNGPRDKQIYYHHKTIIELLNEYNVLFSGVMYQEVVTASLQPCGYGYAIIKAIKSKDTAAFDLVYKILVSTSGPFIMCACGEEINQQVEKLHESSYSCKWYEEEPKVRRDIFTMMLITTRPITVNYRLFIAFNLPCFATISKGFYSYLTMIINFDEN
ncbi:hypothetical protein O3M35_010045 [Rhynocoris fuscipes]|uniref:Uncharacterized protein n=1 Tax=Rhynocoris fuscipes TaxID=488301 RepID=A0AAW1D139_9HEMI